MELKIAFIFALKLAILLQTTYSAPAPVAVFHGLGDSVTFSKYFNQHIVHLSRNEPIYLISSKRN